MKVICAVIAGVLTYMAISISDLYIGPAVVAIFATLDAIINPEVT